MLRAVQESVRYMAEDRRDSWTVSCLICSKPVFLNGVWLTCRYLAIPGPYALLWEV